MAKKLSILAADGPVVGNGLAEADAGLAVPPIHKPVSLRDVAKMANVSVATVSMVLNENPRISRATQIKVRRLIERVGYKPNRIAQSLSSKYTRVVAVMVPALRHTFADVYFGELISGVCERAGKLGHKVMIESAKPEYVKDNKHIELFERRYVDGLLLLGFNDRHHFLGDLVQRGYPVLSVNNYMPDLSLGHVSCDYRGGAEQMMSYLLQLGHRHIGLICGAPETATQRDLIEAYKKGLTSVGVSPERHLVEDGRFTEAGGAAAAESLLSRDPKLTAVFGGNDKMAMGAMHHMTRVGLRVPHDISVTGFDDIAHTAFVNPALTTVHVPLYECGGLACERLIDRIRGRIDLVDDLMPTHLVVRDSTAIAPERDASR